MLNFRFNSKINIIRKRSIFSNVIMQIRILLFILISNKAFITKFLKSFSRLDI